MISISKTTTRIYFIILALLIVVLRLPSLNLILDTDSSENTFFARQMMRGEILYGRFLPDHHLPGIFYTFVVAFKLFGDNPVAPQLLLFAFLFASAWLIFLMGRVFFNDLAGLLSALFYILASSQIYLAGMTVQREHFANLPLIATMLLFLILLRKNAPPAQFIWIGVLGAISILYKIIFIGSLAAVGISILIGAWLERGQAGTGRKLFSRLGSIGMGLMLPLAIVGGYFASMGLWNRLMLAITFGFTYVNDTSRIVVFPKPFGFPLFMVAMNNIALLVFGLIGTYRLIRRAIPLRTSENLTDFALASWLIISFALAGFRGGGYPHYPLIVIPPLALMGGVEISLTYQRWLIKPSHKQAALGASFMAALIVINFFWRNYDLYRQYIPNKSGQESSYQSSQDRQLAVINYIKSHTTPDDFIYVWSINLQLYYYADRIPPVDILSPSYVSATGPPERIFNARTKYIVVDDVKIFSRPQWLLDGLEQSYQLETVIGGMEIYRRTGSQ
jgi:4-amino-4-deoxy-L-arabinose transferase-like glycosyltransferase